MTNAREKEALAQPRYVRGQPLGRRFKNHSACTGKDCRLKNNCARVPKSLGVKYHGPLLHMLGADCIDRSKFVDAIDSHRRLEIRIQKKG